MCMYNSILALFPRGTISYAFAYGSAVKKQLGYNTNSNQRLNNNIVDLIICVKDPLEWHAENMLRQPEHYSALRLFGPRWVTKYQGLAANVYFNTLVPLPDLGIKIKYGVISYEHLLNDLCSWKHLYVAGRLHKPVHHVVEPDHDNRLYTALNINKCSALQVALLLLPHKFSAYQLFCTISNLSYRGDFRMIFGENKNKVDNIVRAQLKEFYDIYKTSMMLLNKYIAIDIKCKDGKHCVHFEQDKSATANEYHLQQIPAELCKRLVRNSAFQGTHAEVISRLAISNTLTDVLQASVNDIVWRSSITQSLKNIPSAGILKSLTYSYWKAMKTFGM